MQYARYQKEPDVWLRVSAEQYDPEAHGKDLRCGDPLCSARVYFRNTKAAMGNSMDDEKTFVSMNRDDHREDCTELSHSLRYYNDMRLEDAFRDDAHILLNLNMDLGDPMSAVYGKQGEANDNPSRYNIWRAQYPHATVRAKSISDYFALYAELDQAKAIERARVGHCQDIRHLSNVHIADNRAKLVRLYNEMAGQPSRNHGVVVGFPRLLTFEPVAREFKNTSPEASQINGNTVTLDENDKSKLLLLNKLILSDGSMRRDIMDFDRTDILAVPFLRKANVSKAQRDYKRGGVAFVSLEWQIVAREQFRPAEGATRHAMSLQADLFRHDGHHHS